MKWQIDLKWQQELDGAVFCPHYCSASSSIGFSRTLWARIVLEKRRSSRYQQQRLSDLNFCGRHSPDWQVRTETATRNIWSRRERKKVGLTINSKKTKVMDVAKERNDITTTLSNQNSLENVDKFVNLGSTISHNGNLTSELDNSIGKAANVFNRLLPVMRHKSVKMPRKTAIYKKQYYRLYCMT